MCSGAASVQGLAPPCAAVPPHAVSVGGFGAWNVEFGVEGLDLEV